MLSFVLVFSISFLISTTVNWVLLNYSINLGIRNISAKEEIRWQKHKSSIGGLSFYIVFLIFYAILSNLILVNAIPNASFDFYRDVSLMSAASIGFFIGLIDDARNTNPLLKLLGQIICGVTLVCFNQIIPISPNLFWNSFFTILWVVFLMNSINMLDNMDGLTASISNSILIGCAIIFVIENYTLSNIITISIIGTLLGFLIFNWYPSRIYMGDSGSQFLGIVLAHISIYTLWQNRTADGGYFQLNQFFLPLLFFTIPIFDTTTVIIHRLLRKQSPFVGGKDHISHHLVFLGLKDWQAVSLLLIINMIFIIIGLKWNEPKFYGCILVLWIASFLIFQYVYIKAKAFIPKHS
jgi:UDP-GlcNAc:undecaprenyl-phosphate GlcNAc-1-phosphate transferase